MINARYSEYVKIQCMEIISLFFDAKISESGIFIGDCLTYCSKFSRARSVPHCAPSSHPGRRKVRPSSLSGLRSPQRSPLSQPLLSRLHHPSHPQAAPAPRGNGILLRKPLSDPGASLQSGRAEHGLPDPPDHDPLGSERAVCAVPRRRSASAELRVPLQRDAVFGVGRISASE